MKVLRLPFPPSTNALWRYVAPGKVSLSQEARKYLHDGLRALRAQQWTAWPADVRLKVALKVCEPDNPDWRGADLDNFSKAVLDLLQKGGVVVNDSQFDRLIVIRGEREGNGCVYVHISELDTG